MDIKTLVVGQLQTNCYLLIDNTSSKALIVDPGDDAEYVQRTISDERLKPVQIIATHGHFDHILAATELQLAYNIPFLIHKKDEFLLKRMNQSSLFFTGVEGGIPPKVSGYLNPRKKIKFTGDSLSVLETPGHTPGSISLYHQKDNLLFCGDLIFKEGGVGRTDFSYSSPLDLQASIDRVIRLPGKTQLFSGHGESSFMEDELQFHA